MTGAAGEEPIWRWTNDLSARARREGWDVWSRTDGPRYEIQALDEGGADGFESDLGAFTHVEAMARAYGAPHHTTALFIHEFYEAEDEEARRKRRFQSGLRRALEAEAAERRAREPSEDDMLMGTVP